VQSDARFRGRSLGAGRPTVSLALSYDGPEGIYLGGTALGVAARHEGLEFLGVQGNIGIARRFDSGLVLDVGIDHSRYSKYYSPGFSARYTEFYVGVVGRNLSSHIYYSPDYFGLGFATVYAEIDGVVRPAERWRVNAHIGVIVRTDGTRAPGYDWRLGVATELRHFDLQLAVSGGGPGPNGSAGARIAVRRSPRGSPISSELLPQLKIPSVTALALRPDNSTAESAVAPPLLE
jgi:uncharacterized protein (TIGR02001 family)